MVSFYMISKKQLKSGAEIHTWFPKNIYINNIDEQYTVEDLKEIENILKSLDSEDINSFEFNVSKSKTINDSIIKKEKKLKELFEKILFSVKEFCIELGYDEEFCKKLSIQYSWFNISKKGDYVQKHIHSNSFLSGTFYVKSGKDDCIRFYDEDMLPSPSNVNNYSYTNTTYNCEPGIVLIFKSNLPHSTNKQTSKEKISISFNVKVKDK